MKQKIVLFIITLAMFVSCFGVVAFSDSPDPDDQPGDIITNPWGDLFTETYESVTNPPWGESTRVTTTKAGGETTVPATTKANTDAEQYPAKVVIKKINKKKYSAKKIKLTLKKAKYATGYQVMVFKSKKNAKKLKKPIYEKSFFKTKIVLKSKKFKNKKKLFVIARGFNKTKAGAWSKIKKVKIKK